MPTDDGKADVGRFGRELMGVRDRMVADVEMIIDGRLRHPKRMELTEELARMIRSDDDRTVITDLALEIIDGVIARTPRPTAPATDEQNRRCRKGPPGA